jgi:hypothetical protein
MPETTPVTRSRLPVIAIAVRAAILAAIVVGGLVFGGHGPTTDTTNSRLGAAGANGAAPLNFNAPLAADPSASPAPSGSAGTQTTPGDNGGPRGFAFGRGGRGGKGGPGFGGGPGGPGGPGKGRGDISITAINGSNLSLKTDDGWTRTIDATGATVTEQGGSSLTVGDLKVGDHIAFRETRNADGTYTINAIVRIPAQAGGTVKTVTGDSATLTDPDGSTTTIRLTGTTTYTLEGKAATKDDLKVGTRVHAVGTTDANGAFTATSVDIEPASVAGSVTSKTADTVTVTLPGGTSATIHVTSATTYETRGKTAATLADVAVGNVVLAQGTLNDDGSLKATDVRIGAFGPGGKLRGPFGGQGGGKGGKSGKGGNSADPNATSAPSANAG